jgi:hypothetical protein
MSAIDTYLEKLTKKTEEKTTTDQKLRELLEEVYGSEVWTWKKGDVIKAVRGVLGEEEKKKGSARLSIFPLIGGSRKLTVPSPEKIKMAQRRVRKAAMKLKK